MHYYYNVMEQLVEEGYENVKSSLKCCQCESCRTDVIALALNILPSKYVSVQKGTVYSKTQLLRTQNMTNIMSALAEAAKIVS